MSPRITVIIPHLEDFARLAVCLHHLERQNLPRASYEICVIDNGSRANRLDLLSRQYPGVRWLEQPSGGSYAARNKGIEQARGELIALTDADCIPSRDWLASGLAQLQDSAGDILGGRVEVFGRTHARSLAERYELQTGFPQRRYIEEENFAVTANLMASRAVFEDVGLFDARLRSGGDVEWCQRAVRAGHCLDYAAEMVVYHPARVSARALLSKIHRTIRGAANRRLRSPGTSHADELSTLLAELRLMLPPARWGFETLLADLDPRDKAALLLFRTADVMIRHATMARVSLERLFDER